MAVYHNRIQAKLAALQAKNLDDIQGKQIYIPGVGRAYNKAQLQSWLNKRIDFLTECLALYESQIIAKMTLIYNSLSAADKLIADKILAGQRYTLSDQNADSYDKLCLIALYKFIVYIEPRDVADPTPPDGNGKK
jgi:hypothetical protein